ncbi:hypothetical protein MMC16_001181 [Acarospora aff. strigata]|nr:hypothetical protein [Acarospora aff. strigata]
MTDYSKLKVVDLKAELKKRGLPQTGLKQALVDRLNEADAKIEEPAPAEEQLEQPVAPVIERQVERVEVIQEIKVSIPDVAPVVNDAVGDISEVLSAATHLASEGGAAVVVVTEENAPMQDAPAEAVEVTPPVAAPIESESSSAQSAPISQKQEEELEDSRKRKRRSQSPRPSSVEVAQKKARQEDGSPRVTLPEDVSSREGLDGLDTKGKGTLPDHDDSVEPRKQEQAHGNPSVGKAVDDDEMMDVSDEQSDRLESTRSGHDIEHPQNNSHQDEAVIEKDEDPAPEDSVASPVKPSPSDTRFKNLFNGPAKRDASPPRQLSQHDDEDRIVTPALHPATSALYIRNFMRPLHPGNLKDHLSSLANPPNSSPKHDIITDFFLDPIRTHSLVVFASIAAASRVRSALHDRVWPDERTRKPLWVDFIPEEKVKEWVDAEQNSTSGRGAPAKRWEVVYENSDQGVRAIFQEIGSGDNRVSLSDMPASGNLAIEAGKGVQGAPSGPRNDSHRKLSDAEFTARPRANMGFKALDDLFKSTVAKPKLYFLPVAKNMVERRMERFRDLRGGPAKIGDEMRRYTFESGDLFVDKGPEFGGGYRGGYRGRGGGGYSGAYGGRGGGGWREDTWSRRGGRP